MSDPILDEIRAARREFADKFHADLQAMGEDLMRRQGTDGRKVVKLPHKAAMAQGISPTLQLPGDLPRGTVES